MHRLYTTLHKTILGFADIGSTEFFFDFFCITPHTRKIKKSTVEFHTSKNILKMIKQRNQSRQVLLFLSNTHLYTGMSISCKQVSLLISKWATPISAQNAAILTNDGKQSLINTNREHCFQ